MDATRSIDVEVETGDPEIITIIEEDDALTMLDPDENAVTKSISGAVVDGTLKVISIKEGIKRAPIAVVDGFIAKEADFKRAAVTTAGNVISTFSRKISNAPAAIAARIEANVDAIERFIAQGADATNAAVDATKNAISTGSRRLHTVLSDTSMDNTRSIHVIKSDPAMLDTSMDTSRSIDVDGETDVIESDPEMFIVIKEVDVTPAKVAAGNVVSTVSRKISNAPTEFSRKISNAPTAIAAGIDVKIDAVDRFVVKGADLTRATVDAAGNVISSVAQKVFSAPKVIAAGIEAKVEAVHRFIHELDARMGATDSIDVIEEEFVLNAPIA